MKVSRGAFLGVCGAALVGSVLDARAHDTTDALLVMPEASGAAAFRPHLSTVFQARRADGSWQDLTLVNVGDRSVDSRVEQFSLLFRGAGDDRLADGVYELRHPELEPEDLFIAAVGPSAHDAFYEACFSRIRGVS